MKIHLVRLKLLLTKNSEPHASVVHRSGVEDADMLALRAHIQRFQAENKEVLFRRGGNQTIHMDPLLKLCTD